jgi:3',5'-cyclic AMP phosphodiesterase CpdA
MAPLTIIQISDLHLSRTHGFFNANWREVLRRIQISASEQVIVSGDLTVDGADSADDLAWAAAELARLGGAALCIPGNHDCGEEFEGAHGQRIDATRRNRWIEHFGVEWWFRELGNWRLLGLNSQLLGSGDPAEATQLAWIEKTLAEASGSPIGVFVHKPLFLEHPGEAPAPGHATLPGPRRRLLELIRRARVRFVACGHLHQYRALHHDGIDYIWAPSTAFLVREQLPGVQNALGYVVHRLFEDGRYAHVFVRMPELTAIDLESLKGGRYRYLRDIPPSAVGAIMAEHGLAAV